MRLEKAQDATLDSTFESTKKIEQFLSTIPEIEIISTVVGATDGTSQPNKAAIYIHLVPKKERTKNTSQVKDLIRPQLEQFATEGTLSIADVDIANSGTKAIQLEYHGRKYGRAFCLR